MMLTANRKRFFLYGLSIAAAEEFLTQGLLRDAYISWIFTLIPFALFLILASCVRRFLQWHARGWIAPLLYYVRMNGICAWYFASCRQLRPLPMRTHAVD